MLSQKVIDNFVPITDEEKHYLSGEKNVDFSLYMEHGGSVINNKKLLSEGQLITLRQHTRFMRFPKHSHDFVEVMYVCAGSVTHIIDGKSIAVSEGELLFLGQNVEHEIAVSSETDIAVNFIILPEFFDSPLAMLKYSNSPLKNFIIDSLVAGKGKTSYMHFCVSDNHVIQNITESLIVTLMEDMPNKFAISGYTMGLMFLHLSNCTECLINQSKSNSAVLEALRYVDEHYREGNLSELAKKLHYDYSWLSHEIKRKTGKTYTDLVQDRRMSQAAFLLKNTDMNILDIATNIGYDNTSYFFTLFYKTFRKTPREYRLSAVEI